MDKPISVAELTDRIKFSLEKEFFEVVIIGEISNFKAHPSGHFYFNLKDEKANLTAVMFRGDNSKIKFKAHDGLKVIAVGKITVYPPRGNYQILVSRMEPEGLGALQLAFEQLKKKLEAEGLFRTERKRPIPKFPRAVGIVTSPSGAAIRDILQILDRRFSGLRVLIYPVKVQGVGAAEEIAQAIQDFNAHFSELDVLIVGRGGGSIEDLWAFNEEVVARAIFQSKMPVISAVGHEVDFTIADFVADLRAPTPSAAAELVIGSKLELITRLDHLMKRLLLVQKLLEFTEMKVDDLFQRLTHVLQQKISALKFEVEKLNAALFRFSPMALLQNQKQKFFYLSDKLYEIPAQHIEDTRVSIQHLEEKLRLLNPRAIMERGYSIVRNVQTMKVIKKVSDVKMGDKLLIELSKGKITAKV
ncbi:MAG: exodeoxyribonuclease VII large subunit [Deltaproteobacteria bacterium]|nr:exodeoxyribonuclease VII large subunit [Deltaproteobacteria bacterium]